MVSEASSGLPDPEQPFLTGKFPGNFLQRQNATETSGGKRGDFAVLRVG